MSKAGLAMLKRFEGCELKAYDDGGGVWTIGWGHTGRDVHEGQEITEAEAERLLAQDVRRAERAVGSRLIGIPLTQGQFDALVSFVYNVGAQAFDESTMLRHLRARDYDAAADEFGRWVFDNKRRVNGLVVRRDAERTMFLAAG